MNKKNKTKRLFPSSNRTISISFKIVHIMYKNTVNELHLAMYSLLSVYGRHPYAKSAIEV